MTSLADVFVTGRIDTKAFGTDIRRGVDHSSVRSASDDAGKKAGKGFTSAFGSALKIGATIAAGFAVVKGIDFLKGSIAEAREAQKASALTAAVIKSTGGAAKVTSGQVADLANAISLKTGIDDEAIQSGENLLLTFKNIRNETGKGNDIFNQATQSVTDMSAALGQDMKSGSIQLGKALNDPIKGITALSRVGVTFTQQQKDQIAAMVESGDTMKAQKVILKELNSEFGGAAESQATAGDKAKVAWQNLQEEVGTKLLPVLDDLENWFTSEGIPKIADGLRWVETDGVAALKSFADEVGPLSRDLLPLFADAGLGVVGMVRQLAPLLLDLLHAFTGLPEPVQKFIVVGGLGALAVSKMSTAFAAFKVTGFAGQLLSAETRTAALGRAAKLAAGGAGLALLFDAMDRAPGKAAGFEEAIGGAALGFAVGGPWGAAIGAGVGGLHALWQQQDHVVTSFSDGVTPTQDFASSLDQVTGAATKATRQLAYAALQQSEYIDDAGNVTHLTDVAHDLGFSMRDLVNVTLEVPGAATKVQSGIDAITRSIEDGTTGLKGYDLIKLQTDLGLIQSALPAVRGQIRANTKAWQDENTATKTYGEALKGLPKSVVSELRQDGFDVSIKQLRQLHHEYDLTPKELKIIARETGMGAVITKTGQVKKALEDVPEDTKPRITPQGIADAMQGIGNVDRSLAGLNSRSARPKVVLDTSGFFSQIGAVFNKLNIFDNTTATATAGVLRTPFGATGGRIVGPGTGTSDSIDLRASNGEFMVNAKQTAANLGILHAINNGTGTFHVGGLPGFAGGGPVGSRPGDAASDTQSWVDRLVSALRDAVGPGSPMVAHLKDLGDKLVALQRRQDRLSAQYDKATDALVETMRAQNAEARSIASAFTHDAFSGSLADAKLQLQADINDARSADKNLGRARHRGLTGAALRFLSESGNTGLISEVGHMTRKELRQFEELVRKRNRATGALGADNAAALFAKDRREEHKDMRDLIQQLRQTNEELRYTGDRVETGARRGNADRQHRAQTKRQGR